MSIVIGCDSFLSLRNVRNGDLGRRLAGERVIVLTDPAQYDGSLQACPPGVELEKLLPFNADNERGLAPLLKNSYYTRKSYYDPATFWVKMRASSYKSNPRPGLRRAASIARARLTVAKHWLDGKRGLAQPRRQAFVRALRSHAVSREYQKMLREWDAQLVVAFSLEGPREMALMEAAHALEIPVAVMIRSRDNLASKIQHLPDADAYFVWSEVARDFLLKLYPEVSPERVFVTGSPQFDRHLNPDFHLSREEFFQTIGLDPARPLIVYTTATPNLIPHEIEIVQFLADTVRDKKLHRDGVPAQLLVRGHPRGFGSSHPLLHKTYPGVSVFPPPGPAPYQSEEHESQVVRLILEDEPLHLATLAYQDVQVNVSGTMTVDSAILDKPIVNIYFDLPAGIAPGLSVRRFYQRSDYKPLLKTGGLRLAHNPEEGIALINRYLAEPSLDAAGRKIIRDTDCGPLDGSAGERIARHLYRLMGTRNEAMRAPTGGAH